MFNPDFYPTPLEVIEKMISGIELQGKTILEPSAGSCSIVDVLQQNGASVLACENDQRLKAIVKSKCKHIADNFLTLKSEDVSHIHAVVMNPPFSRGAEHLIHAYNIAPKGCRIVCLLNAETLKNPYSMQRKELFSIVSENGSWSNIGNCFSTAERQTDVQVALITLQKAGDNYSTEFEGFFMGEDPEEAQENGIMSYNAVRDLVNRYVAALKIYDEQLEAGKKMNSLLSGFYGESLAFSCTEKGAPKLRNDFKVDLQKAAWKFVISKFDLNKYATRGLREDINRFTESQQNIPFTMRNVYKMIEMIIGTAGNRMDAAILEAFDMLTKHHHDNRFNVKGWKTNGHFLVGKKFILPNMVSPAKEYGYTSATYNYFSHGNGEKISDLEKALCFACGINYDKILTIYHSISRNSYGEYYDNCEFFKYKAFKNGNMHFEFKSEKVWEQFNAKVAQLKGYPLFEAKPQTEYQKRQTGRTKDNTAPNAVLFEMEF